MRIGLIFSWSTLRNNLKFLVPVLKDKIDKKTLLYLSGNTRLVEWNSCYRLKKWDDIKNFLRRKKHITFCQDRKISIFFLKISVAKTFKQFNLFARIVSIFSRAFVSKPKIEWTNSHLVWKHETERKQFSFTSQKFKYASCWALMYTLIKIFIVIW